MTDIVGKVGNVLLYIHLLISDNYILVKQVILVLLVKQSLEVLLVRKVILVKQVV